MHRISKIITMIERSPEAYIVDIEMITGKSYRTARRIMAKIRMRYNIHGRKHPTMEQVREFFELNK